MAYNPVTDDAKLRAQAWGELGFSPNQGDFMLNEGGATAAQKLWFANRFNDLVAKAKGPSGNQAYLDTLGRMSVEDMLRDAPELRPYYEAYKPMFERYVSSGGPMKISTSQWLNPGEFGRSDLGDKVRADKLGVRYARNADELAWNWMHDYLANQGIPGYGIEVKPWTEPMPPDQWINARYDYNADKSWWERKGAPGLQTGMAFLSMLPGLNPIGALGKGFGTMLGSKLAGNAIAGAIGSAAVGGDPLKGGLSSLVGGLGGKLSHSLGDRVGNTVTGGLTAAANGGDVLRGMAGGYLGGMTANDNKSGGGGEGMGDFNWKDVVGPAIAGALLNQSSAGTGAAAGAALGLMGSGGFGFGDKKMENVLNSAAQGYLENKLFGMRGDAGALAGAGKGFYNSYIANGKNDDALRELLGIEPGSKPVDLGGLGEMLGIVPDGHQDDVLRDFLRQKIEEALDKYFGKSQQGGASWPRQMYQLPDVYSLYNQYYNQLPGASGDYDAAVKSHYDSTKAMMGDDFRQQSDRIDSDLNRRGLFSSGIALSRQDELRNKFLEALSREAGQSSLEISKARADAENRRRAQAMDLAQSRLSTLMKYPSGMQDVTLPKLPDGGVIFNEAPASAAAGGVGGGGSSFNDFFKSLQQTAPAGGGAASNGFNAIGGALSGVFGGGGAPSPEDGSTMALLDRRRRAVSAGQGTGTRLFADIATPSLKSGLFSFGKKALMNGAVNWS